MNPNNCSTCDHKKTPDGGWCYMFRDAPVEVCKQHTLRKGDTSIPSLLRDCKRLIEDYQLHLHRLSKKTNKTQAVLRRIANAQA